MLIDELRELLKEYDEKDLRLIITEMYKSIPKKLREEKSLDVLVKNIHSFVGDKSEQKSLEKQVDVYKLKDQIELFIEYAYKQYFFAPNQFVHKKDRPKWRFMVKDYIKNLQSTPARGEEGILTTQLLENLYKMLCYASAHYLFSTDNPFRSIGIAQTGLLDSILSRKFYDGYETGSIRSAILLVVENESDRETLHSSLSGILINNLKTNNAKELAVSLCLEIRNEYDLKSKSGSKKSWKDRDMEYALNTKKEYLLNLTVDLYLQLCEYERAVSYFNKYHVERDKEIALYVLLNNLHRHSLKEYWLKEYQEAVNKGVKPRPRLQETYHFIQQNNKLPECIYFVG